MNFTTQELLTALVLLLIVGIFLDGFRRMRKARRDSLKMSLDLKNKKSDDGDNGQYGSEFPNGGARTSSGAIDKDRIEKARSQYDFGADLTTILRRNKELHAEDSHDVEADSTHDEDQWLDSDDGDEEYYGKQWDDEYDFDNEHDTEEDDTLVEESHPVEAPQPEQVSLNLDETVPVLMETADSDAQSVKGQDTDILLDDEALAADVQIRPVGTKLKRAIEPTLSDDDDLETHSANKPRFQSKYFSRESKKEVVTSPELQEVLILHIKANDDESFSGNDVLQQAIENGLRYGAMNIFHYHVDEDGEGPVLFSMANMLMPGVFDLKNMDTFTTVGVTFFLTMPVAGNENMPVFETMVATAKNMAIGLGGELKDEQRSIMTAQTIEHYRERVRDFARRQRLEKNK